MNYVENQDLFFTGGISRDTLQTPNALSCNYSTQPNVLDESDLDKFLDMEFGLEMTDGATPNKTIQGTTVDDQNSFDNVVQLTKDGPMQPPNRYTIQKPMTNNLFATMVPSEASPSTTYLSNLTYSGVYPENTLAYAAGKDRAASVPDFVADTPQYPLHGGPNIESISRNPPQTHNTHPERATTKKKSVKIKCTLKKNDRGCEYVATSQNDMDRHRITKHKKYKDGDIYYVCHLGGSKCSETKNFRKDNFRHHLKTKHRMDLSGKDDRLKQFAKRWSSPCPENSAPLSKLEFFGFQQVSSLENVINVESIPEDFPITDGSGNLDLNFSLGLDMDTDPAIRGNLALATGVSDSFHKPFLKLQNSQDPTTFGLGMSSSPVTNNGTDLYGSNILSGDMLLTGQDVYQVQGGNTDFFNSFDGLADMKSQENTTDVDIDESENPDADTQIDAPDKIEGTQSLSIPENRICLTDLYNSSNSQPSSHAMDIYQGPTSSNDCHFKPMDHSMPTLVANDIEEPQPKEQQTVGAQETLLSQESEEYEGTLSSRSSAPNVPAVKKNEFEIPPLEVEDEGEDVTTATVAPDNEGNDEKILRMFEGLPEASQSNILRALASRNLKNGTRVGGQTRATHRASSSPSGPNNPLASNNDNSAVKKLWTCNFCDGSYPRQSVLKKHMRRHSRPYPCLQRGCTRLFGSKSDWKRHDAHVHRDSRLFRLSRVTTDKQEDKASDGLREYEDINDSHDFWCGFCQKEITHHNFYTHVERHVVPKPGQKTCTMADWVPNQSTNVHGSGNKSSH